MQTAFKATAGIGVFVAIETYKPILLQRAWMAGVVCELVVILLFGLNAIANIPALVAVVAALTLVAAALIGWWVCNNKKDDLNMLRAVQRFNSLLLELDAAEQDSHFDSEAEEEESADESGEDSSMESELEPLAE